MVIQTKRDTYPVGATPGHERCGELRVDKPLRQQRD